MNIINLYNIFYKKNINVQLYNLIILLYFYDIIKSRNRHRSLLAKNVNRLMVIKKKKSFYILTS